MGAMCAWAHEVADAVVGWDAPPDVRVAILLRPDENQLVVRLTRAENPGLKAKLYFYPGATREEAIRRLEGQKSKWADFLASWRGRVES